MASASSEAFSDALQSSQDVACEEDRIEGMPAFIICWGFGGNCQKECKLDCCAIGRKNVEAVESEGV